MNGATLLAKRGGVLIIMNSLGFGGGDRVAVLLANGFAAAGIPTRIALMKDSTRSEAEIRSLLSGVPVASAGPPMGLRLSKGRPPLGHRHLERLRGVAFLQRQIDELRPGVVLGASDNLGLITALARPPEHRGVVFALKLTNRLFRPNTGAARRFFRHRLFKFIFDRLDLVLTLSEADRRDATAHYPLSSDKFVTTANPYVTATMMAERQRAREGPPRLLSAGRLVRQKRFDVLLRAFALVPDSEARLTIVGDGPLRAQLEKLALELGIADRVDMPGYSEVVSHLRKSGLFVLSSDYEGLPAVVIEALACNVPVVTTDSFLAAQDMLGSLPSCAVVPIDDPDALASAIDRCLAAGKAPDLRKIAGPYRVDAGISAHIDALARAVAAQKRTETPV